MITVVTGPPCSGKSTYVRNHAKPGDIVIDFDTLAQSIGSPVPHDHSPAVRNVVIRMRRAAIDAALRITDADVWIVDCNISPERLHAYRAARAVIRSMTADTDELHRRASRERPALWHSLIDRWSPPPDAVAIASPSRDW